MQFLLITKLNVTITNDTILDSRTNKVTIVHIDICSSNYHFCKLAVLVSEKI